MNSKQRSLSFVMIFYCNLVSAGHAIAQEYSFWYSPSARTVLKTPEEGCEYLYSPMFWEHLIEYYNPGLSYYSTTHEGKVLFNCGNTIVDPSIHSFGIVEYNTLNCDNGKTLDFSTGACGAPAQKGRQVKAMHCDAPSSFIGNPVNFLTGNKYQEELDIKVGTVDQIVVSRSYNSIGSSWRHSYSTYLYVGEEIITLVFADGRQADFSINADHYSSSTDLGILSFHDGIWKYQSPSGEILHFSSGGQLAKIEDGRGGFQTLTYKKKGADTEIEIKNAVGDTVFLTEAPNHQIKTLESGLSRISYSYQGQNIVSRTRMEGRDISYRYYHYEDYNDNRRLTGITDERGVRLATWTYDWAGRAVTSQHSEGAGMIRINYQYDASVVTNELGKRAAYRYQTIGGVKHITAIEGEPSPNCPASNSSYTYNDLGQVLTKTDAKGLITTYTYNDRGLETSRTEATGTPLARTTTTEWDPTRFLPVRIVEPDRTTLYSYDAKGRELSRQTIIH